MAAVSGENMTLSVEGDVLAAARTVTISFSQATIDATSADSGRNGEYLAGRRDVTIDVDALYIYDDVAKKVLQAHFTEGSPKASLPLLSSLALTRMLSQPLPRFKSPEASPHLQANSS